MMYMLKTFANATDSDMGSKRPMSLFLRDVSVISAPAVSGEKR